MIALLKGLVALLGDDHAVIDVGGVGYRVYCSSRSLGRMAKGEAVMLHVETHVREDHIHLFGFLAEIERDWFNLLTTVQGVGARVALGILGVLETDDLLRAIAAADKAAVTQAPGVGPKLAARILSELKDKAGKLALGAAARGDMPAGPQVMGTADGNVGDAVSALVNLGYSPSQALVAVSSAAGRLGTDAPIETLIREGLGELAPADHAAAAR